MLENLEFLSRLALNKEQHKDDFSVICKMLMKKFPSKISNHFLFQPLFENSDDIDSLLLAVNILGTNEKFLSLWDEIILSSHQLKIQHPHAYTNLLTQIAKHKMCLIQLGVSKHCKKITYEYCKKEIFPSLVYLIESGENDEIAMDFVESNFLAFSIKPIADNLVQDLLKLFETNTQNRRMKNVFDIMFLQNKTDKFYEVDVMGQKCKISACGQTTFFKPISEKLKMLSLSHAKSDPWFASMLQYFLTIGDLTVDEISTFSDIIFSCLMPV